MISNENVFQNIFSWLLGKSFWLSREEHIKMILYHCCKNINTGLKDSNTESLIFFQWLLVIRIEEVVITPEPIFVIAPIHRFGLFCLPYLHYFNTTHHELWSFVCHSTTRKIKEFSANMLQNLEKYSEMCFYGLYYTENAYYQKVEIQFTQNFTSRKEYSQWRMIRQQKAKALKSRYRFPLEKG